ncbi:hypothetical protein LMG28138_04814 [Pararobbsia alpina]|uniref:Uncharacterized protein n=1 Tax=Pararobbsia alpina TaxID=621374 RepID=A0A6S7C322_9BURK|nr:hypothetical protein LMG28138_04814 [Pararobbsia alpina]
MRRWRGKEIEGIERIEATAACSSGRDNSLRNITLTSNLSSIHENRKDRCNDGLPGIEFRRQ